MSTVGYFKNSKQFSVVGGECVCVCVLQGTGRTCSLEKGKPRSSRALCVTLRNLSFTPKAVLESFNQKHKMIRIVSQKHFLASV